MPPRKAAVRTSAVNNRKAKRADATKPRKGEIEIVPMSDALWRVVQEVTTARIRHRALLAVLAGGAYSWDLYVERYDEFLRRDGSALFAQIVLPEDDFENAFATWIAEDMKRYGFLPRDMQQHAESQDAKGKKRK